MLIGLRKWTVQTAVALLVSLPALLAPHSFDERHDAENRLGLVAHDESHRFAALPSEGEAHPLHCVVCHMARLLRPHVEVRSLPAPTPHIAARITLELITASSAAPAEHPSLRSPPESPVSV
jgi:hypothetical protein